MELTGERRLAVDRATAWAALNDPDILRASIPGCESFEKIGDNEYAVAVLAALGPVRAKFGGKLFLEDVVAPERYVLRFEGQGGAAGFVKGTARVNLSEDTGGTLLRYAVAAQVGGRIAQVGSRLVDSAALKLADDFFAAFQQKLVPRTDFTEMVPRTDFRKSVRGTIFWGVAAAAAAAIALYACLR